MIDINKPITNPELVKAINEMAENNSQEKWNKVIDEVMKAHFISPIIISPSPEHPTNTNEVVLKQDTKISFNMIENNENQQFFLSFTDWEELRKWHFSENQQTLITTFDDLASMVLNEKGNAEGFVINPYGGSITFNKELIRSLKEEKERRAKGGVVEQVVKRDTTVKLGQPRVYPKQMVDAISQHLKNKKNVKAAYLQLMIKEEEQSYLVIIDFTGDKREVFDGVAKVAMTYLNGMFLDMVPIDDEFGRTATRNVEPFYKRKSFGLF
jgi:SseB protein.